MNTYHIKDNYWRCHYDNVNIIIKADTSFVNASNLCRYYGKVFAHWQSKVVTGELIKSCENEMKLEHLNYPEYPYECSESIVFQPTDDIDLSGYYVHPYLVHYLMQWLKTAYAISFKNGKLC